MNHLLSKSALQTLDREVSHKASGRLGFLLIDAQGQEPDVRIHIRPFMRGGDGCPFGFRVERLAQPLTKPDASGRYITIIASIPDGELPDEVLDYVDGLQSRSLPWLRIESTSGSNRICLVNEEGVRIQLEDEPPLVSQQLLRVTIEGYKQRPKLSLPAEVAVDSDAGGAILSVCLEDNDYFASANHYLSVFNPSGAPLGRGLLKMDVKCNFGGKDRLELTPFAFEGDVEAEYLREKPELEKEVRFHDGQLVLHLVYDRTAIDAEKLPVVFESLAKSAKPAWEDQGVRIGDTADATRETSEESLNLKLREGLAGALESKISELHNDVMYYLWCFADRTREGIASNTTLPFSTEPFNRVGACSLADLSGRLRNPIFDYATGYDMVDAVDEAMDAVASHVRENRRQQHAVLIVGDSPPPPYGAEDPLWTALTGAGENRARSSSRRSELFKRALDELNRLDAPVAWLYLRLDPAALANAQRGAQNQLRRLHGLKEDILIALARQEHLIVEGCAHSADFPATLSTIFGKMAWRMPKTTGFRILRVSPIH